MKLQILIVALSAFAGFAVGAATQLGVCPWMNGNWRLLGLTGAENIELEIFVASNFEDRFQDLVSLTL